jgi:glutamate/tyrosine decarboxylase-like PLP-dependent enzyme
VEQARYLERLIGAHADLQLMAPVPLNVVCFRYVGRGGQSAVRSEGTEDRLDSLNTDVLVRLQEEGIAAPTSTLLGGRFALRVCITNHRMRLEDMDLLVNEVVRLARELEGGPT